MALRLLLFTWVCETGNREQTKWVFCVYAFCFSVRHTELVQFVRTFISVTVETLKWMVGLVRQLELFCDLAHSIDKRIKLNSNNNWRDLIVIYIQRRCFPGKRKVSVHYKSFFWGSKVLFENYRTNRRNKIRSFGKLVRAW